MVVGVVNQPWQLQHSLTPVTFTCSRKPVKMATVKEKQQSTVALTCNLNGEGGTKPEKLALVSLTLSLWNGHGRTQSPWRLPPTQFCVIARISSKCSYKLWHSLKNAYTLIILTCKMDTILFMLSSFSLLYMNIFFKLRVEYIWPQDLWISTGFWGHKIYLQKPRLLFCIHLLKLTNMSEKQSNQVQIWQQFN